MQSGIDCVVRGMLLLAALLLTGCETTQISAKLPPPPEATLGPQFTVLKAPRYSYLINSVADGVGRVHLILARDQEVRHTVIGLHGVESSEIIRANFISKATGLGRPKVVDLAFDRAGTLHALIDDEHLVNKGGAWLGGQRTPWGEAHIEPRNESPGDISFVKGMPDLTWAFYLHNTAVGLPTRLIWSTAGTIGSPEIEDTWRMAVVPEETPYRHWNILRMEDPEYTAMFELAGDERSTVHAVYAVRIYGSPWDLRYAIFRPDDGCHGEATPTWYPRPPKLASGMPVCPIIGTSMFGHPPLTPRQSIGPSLQLDEEKVYVDWDVAKVGFAMNHATGAVLMAGPDGTSVVAGGEAGGKVEAEIPIVGTGFVLKSAGNGRFHALAAAISKFDWSPPVYYLAYSKGAWSAPIQVGEYASDFFGGLGTSPAKPRTDVFRIVAGKGGRALLLWPTEDALVGRWVTLK